MKKMDMQFLTPTKQREMTPRNPTLPTKTFSKKLRISWRRYKMQLTKMYKMHIRIFKTPKIKNTRRCRNN
jgi:hypothetical protein